MASPMASAAVVLLVGARLSGHASRSTFTKICAVEYFANNESGLPVIAMIGIWLWRTMGINLSSSSVCPELLSANTMSSGVITPKSPWYTSKGLIKNAGVPVLESVAAIFAPMLPLLPTPVTMTLPLQWKIISTAWSKFSSNCPTRSLIACASSVRHWMAKPRAMARRSVIDWCCMFLVENIFDNVFKVWQL